MTARIKISQAGLAAGVAGKSRTDGLDTGAVVTLEDVSGTGASTFHLLDAPPEDTTAEGSLAATGDPDIWEFTPTVAAYGSYLIELRENGVPVERRVFGIRTAINHLLIPAFNERASRHAALDNDGADQIDLSNNNADDFPTASLNSRRYTGWWRSWRELYDVVEAGTGGIADHAIALVKLASAPGKSVIANVSNALGDAAYVAGSAAFQHLRVNSTNDGLEWSTLGVEAIAPIAARSVIANATNGSAAPTALQGTTGFHYLRVNAVGAALEWGAISVNTLAAQAARSVIANATNGSAAPTALQGSAAFQHLRVNSANNALEWATLTATAFAAVAAKTVLTNVGSGSAVPAFSAAPGPLLSLRSNVTDNGLEWAGLGTAVQTTAASLTNSASVLSTTPTINIPANSLAVGSRFRCSFGYRFVRGATATPLNLNSFFDVVAFPSIAMAAQTAAGTYEMRVEGELTILSTGAGGTAMGILTAYGTGSTTPIATSSSITIAIDTTIAIAMRGAAQMNTAVPNTSITALGGHIERIN